MFVEKEVAKALVALRPFAKALEAIDPSSGKIDFTVLENSITQQEYLSSEVLLQVRDGRRTLDALIIAVPYDRESLIMAIILRTQDSQCLAVWGEQGEDGYCALDLLIARGAKQSILCLLGQMEPENKCATLSLTRRGVSVMQRLLFVPFTEEELTVISDKLSIAERESLLENLPWVRYPLSTSLSLINQATLTEEICRFLLISMWSSVARCKTVIDGLNQERCERLFIFDPGLVRQARWYHIGHGSYYSGQAGLYEVFFQKVSLRVMALTLKSIFVPDGMPFALRPSYLSDAHYPCERRFICMLPVRIKSAFCVALFNQLLPHARSNERVAGYLGSLVNDDADIMGYRRYYAQRVAPQRRRFFCGLIKRPLDATIGMMDTCHHLFTKLLLCQNASVVLADARGFFQDNLCQSDTDMLKSSPFLALVSQPGRAEMTPTGEAVEMQSFSS